MIQVSEVVVAGNNGACVAFHCARKVDVVGGVIYDGGNAQYPGGYDYNFFQPLKKPLDFLRRPAVELFDLGIGQHPLQFTKNGRRKQQSEVAFVNRPNDLGGVGMRL